MRFESFGIHWLEFVPAFKGKGKWTILENVLCSTGLSINASAPIKWPTSTWLHLARLPLYSKTGRMHCHTTSAPDIRRNIAAIILCHSSGVQFRFQLVEVDTDCRPAESLTVHSVSATTLHTISGWEWIEICTIVTGSIPVDRRHVTNQFRSAGCSMCRANLHGGNSAHAPNKLSRESSP